MGQVAEVQSWTYGVIVYAWNRTSGTVKREVHRFAKEVVLDNAEDIERTVKEMVTTAAFSAMVTSVSQKLVTELGPAAVNAFSKSDIAKSILDIQGNAESLRICSSQVEQMKDQMEITNWNVHRLSESLAESVAMITEANTRGEIHLLENNVSLNQKLAEISMQIEYLRVNQPNQFREIMNTVSLSTLALNDIGLPSNLVDTFAKLTSTLGSSASQKGNRRLENI